MRNIIMYFKEEEMTTHHHSVIPAVRVEASGILLLRVILVVSSHICLFSCWRHFTFSCSWFIWPSCALCFCILFPILGFCSVAFVSVHIHYAIHILLPLFIQFFVITFLLFIFLCLLQRLQLWLFNSFFLSFCLKSTHSSLLFFFKILSINEFNFSFHL